MEAIGNLVSQTLQVKDEDSQPYSTGVPIEWLRMAEAVFERLAIHYGAARMAAHWNGVNADKAKQHWGRALIRMDRRSVGYALKNLPDMPPTVDEFCDIARRCPKPHVPFLGYKETDEDKAHRRERLAEIKRQFHIGATA